MINLKLNELPGTEPSSERASRKPFTLYPEEIPS